jgi:hypothetical protein
VSYEKFPTVVFFSEWAKGDRPEQCKEAGVEINSYYLQDELGIRAFKPFRIVALPIFFDYFAKYDNAGKLFATSLTKQADTKFKQSRLACVLVVEEDDSAVTPAFITTSGGQNRLWDKIAAAEKAANSDAWFRRGPAFVATKNASKSCFRFVSIIGGAKEKTQDQTGDFILGYSQPAPASETLIGLLNAFTADDLAPLKQAFDFKVKKLLEVSVD